MSAEFAALTRAIREVDRRVREVERNMPKTMGRIAASGGTFTIKTVKTLPDIPTSPTLVWWTSTDGGQGDDQLWASAPDETQWWPMMKFTILGGAV